MQLYQSTSFNYPILLVNSGDHITGKTGAVMTIYLSKAGGGFQLIDPLVIELGFGEYTIVLTPAHTSTVGAFSLHVVAAGADPFDSFDQVVPVPSIDLVPPGGVLATLLMLKLILGIDPDDSEQDGYLAQLLRNAVANIEGMTKQRFREPEEKTEYRDGHGKRILYLHGHMDPAVSEASPIVTVVAPGAAEDDSIVPITPMGVHLPIGYVLDFGPSKLAKLSTAASIDDESLSVEALARALEAGDEASVTTALRVSRRAKYYPGAWEELVEDEDFERRGDSILFLRSWYVWPCEDEFRITYFDGYVTAPDDIREAIIDMAMNQFWTNSSAAAGTAGVTGEKLGDFSYTTDLSATAVGSGTLSDTTKRTIMRYKRMLV